MRWVLERRSRSSPLLLDEKAKNGGVSLVVCPASLVYNWENEFAQFAPELKIMTAAGNQAEREEMFAAYETEKPDVIITSYDLLKRDILCIMKRSSALRSSMRRSISRIPPHRRRSL